MRDSFGIHKDSSDMHKDFLLRVPAKNALKPRHIRCKDKHAILNGEIHARLLVPDKSPAIMSSNRHKIEQLIPRIPHFLHDLNALKRLQLALNDLLERLRLEKPVLFDVETLGFIVHYWDQFLSVVRLKFIL